MPTGAGLEGGSSRAAGKRASSVLPLQPRRLAPAAREPPAAPSPETSSIAGSTSRLVRPSVWTAVDAQIFFLFPNLDFLLMLIY